MKIAYLVHDYHRFGGHSRYVAELATRMSRQHEVHIFANSFDKDCSDDIVFHRVPAWRLNAWTTVVTFAAGIRMRMHDRFDIIHAQGYCGYQGNVVTSHICNAAWAGALKELNGKLTWRERIFGWTTSSLEKSLYKNTRQHVIAISTLVANDLAEHYEFDGTASIIPHGVDLVTFSPRTREQLRSSSRGQLGIGETQSAYLYIGDLRKGARQCVLALTRLDRAHLVLVSRSEPDELASLAREVGVSERTHFLPFTREVQRWYAAADSFLLPTPYDTFGMVVTEAMACGLPVIVSRAAGASELIRSGVDGLVLDDPRDVARLASQMAWVQRCPAEAWSMGSKARTTVESLSWDAIADRTLDVYRRVAGAARQ